MLATQVFDEALALPREKRERLAECLTESLDAEEKNEFPLTDAWLDELQRRDAEWEAGRAQVFDGETVIASLRARFARR